MTPPHVYESRDCGPVVTAAWAEEALAEISALRARVQTQNGSADLDLDAARAAAMDPARVPSPTTR